MTQFVFWTGAISILAGASMQFTSVLTLLMPSEQPGMIAHLFGAMAVFIGIMLILCSRDLKRRGALEIDRPS